MYNMASLFGKNKLREIATKLQTSDLEEKIALVKTWHNDYHKGSLKLDKETSREQAYNQDFFIKILGYREKPAVPYSFEPKATTDKGQLPDAVLSYTDVTKDIKNIAAAVELKGASIDLDRPQRREGNMSPVQQGFKYKTQYRNCPFVVVSNFWELRLYHDNQLDYELWTLDDLIDPEDDYLKFKTFYTLLHSDNLTTPKGASKTEGWLSDIRSEQEEIGKKFYKIYREARLDLLRDIYRHNESIRSDIVMGIEKAQKIIDRLVFACFAEDRGLLPDDTLERVVKAADNSAFGGSLWSTFKAFFEAIDVGSEKLEIPDGYNGGLFATDQLLNSLKVSDEPLRKIASISNYNFAEDLSVSILGHIFEQSISDLEEIKSRVEESENLESIQQSRRKKDGIFYTPDYIVRFIVDNSLGTYLHEEEERLKVEFKLKGDITDKNYEKRERQAYGNYQEFLQNVKVLDPACGSGAFLVYVFDYLLAENKRVASILGNNLFSGEDYIKSILQNNIYGVDLNDESVEITKLSLWLKSAQKGKKLTTLDNNIKCGNSLIDEPQIAGDKAFNWQKEFPEIFANGGFNVVVGNPPYVATKQIAPEDRNFYWNEYTELLFSEMDLYEIFTYKSITRILRQNGYLGFITPDSYFTNASFQHYRKYLLENTKIKVIADFPYRFFPFADVNTETAILILKKQKDLNSDVQLMSLNKQELLISRAISNHSAQTSGNIKQSEVLEKFGGKIIIKQDLIVNRLLQTKGRFGDKLSLHKGWMSVPTSTIVNGNNIEQGIFTKQEVQRQQLGEITEKYLEGRDIHRYYTDPVEKYVNTQNIDKKTKDWHNQEKIILQRIVGQNKNKIFATFDSSNYIIFPNANLLNAVEDKPLKPYLALLNSRLISYFYNSYFGESNTNLTKVALEGLPLPDLDQSTLSTLQSLVDKILEQTSQSNNANAHFCKLISAEFGLEKWPTKLNRWWTLDFSDFANAFKVNLTLAQKDELLQLFEKYKSECAMLDAKVQETDHEIDHLVYRLYDLTPDEIAVVDTGSK